MTDTHDPVLLKRAKISRLTSLALRFGAGLYAAATALFILAIATEFTQLLATLITICLILGSLVLAPAMVFHYAIKAADRADRENSW